VSVPTDPVLGQLGHAQVQCAPGPMQRQMRENHDLLLSLDEDAMLRPFRLRAGRAAPGCDMGGWYDAEAFAPGATFGQWLGALSRFHAITGDGPTRDKVHRLLRGFAATIELDGRFFRNNRFPAYIYDKLAAGLLDAQLLTQADDALAVLAHTTQAVQAYLPARAVPRNEHSQPGEDFTHHAWDESYTLPETQFLAWHSTGDDTYRSLAVRFLYDDFFAALAAGDNVLPGKHAYSHVNALSSAAQAYLSLHTVMHLDAARQGFAMIEAQSYATGGWGPDEHFIEPGVGALGASLVDCTRSFETPCGAYAHVKLSRYLLRITRDARYGDSMERVIYNTALGALPLQRDGCSFYYSDYSRNARKIFHWDRWPCCSGTLPLLAADYAVSLCFTDPAGLYVNLYAPAQVTWQQGGIHCRLRMTTDYPYDGIVSLELNIPASLRFTLRLRIPAWTPAAHVHINGRRDPLICQPGTFAVIDREWHPGDRVDLELSLPLRTLCIDAQHTDTVALMAGPVVLMRMLDAERGPETPLSTHDLLSARRPVATAHEWQVQTPGAPLRFRPFMDIRDEPYRMYQDAAAATRADRNTGAIDKP
jgi:DUF1680 family protein